MAKGKEKRKTVRQRDGANVRKKERERREGKSESTRVLWVDRQSNVKKIYLLIRLFFRTTHEIARYMVKKGHENSAHRWVSGDLVLLLPSVSKR